VDDRNPLETTPVPGVPRWAVALILVGFVPIYIVFALVLPYAGYEWLGTVGLLIGVLADVALIATFIGLRRSATVRAWTAREARAREKPIDFSQPLWRRLIP
jgi:hypothetical protein